MSRVFPRGPTDFELAASKTVLKVIGMAPDGNSALSILLNTAIDIARSCEVPKERFLENVATIWDHHVASRPDGGKT